MDTNWKHGGMTVHNFCFVRRLIWNPSHARRSHMRATLQRRKKRDGRSLRRLNRQNIVQQSGVSICECACKCVCACVCVCVCVCVCESKRWTRKYEFAKSEEWKCKMTFCFMGERNQLMRNRGAIHQLWHKTVSLIMGNFWMLIIILKLLYNIENIIIFNSINT